MRALILTTLSLLITLTPAASDAKPHHHGKGKGKHGDKGVVAKIAGAGQRLHFSFGGELTLRKNGKMHGTYILVANPQAPNGTTLSVACRFFQFDNATLNGSSLSFRAKGKCATLSTAGEVQRIDVVNEFDIIDNGDEGDQINVDFVGPTGIAIPAGALSFGNITIENTEPPQS